MDLFKVSPEAIYGELFQDVQMSEIFTDSKTFVDCIPKREPGKILADYKEIKSKLISGTALRSFIEENFIIPQKPISDYATNETDVVNHINHLWTVLRRKSDSVIKGSSLLALPYEYIVPGGRFREIYYWDSYFTMLGLKESKEYDLMENMVKNFAYLIETYGHMPNGNRTYYLSRSQPPVFSLMIDLLAEIKDKRVYIDYLPALEKEYNYWMDKSADTRHVVIMPDNSILNRYYDQSSDPRPESFKEDVSVGYTLEEDKRPNFYRHMRSAAESGWDFSSRWQNDPEKLSSIHITDLIPIDLNSLLYHVEVTLGRIYQQIGNNEKSLEFENVALKRKTAIHQYCWSATENWYVDYNIAHHKQSSSLTLAGMFPFFLQTGEINECKAAKVVLEKNFLKSGGLVTTLIQSGEQWDGPNGWAPLQWIAIKGLENYGENALAKEIAQRWTDLNIRIFQATGKLEEKYDVVDADKSGSGGEYPSQDGFGWTNGVLLALINKYNIQYGSLV